MVGVTDVGQKPYSTAQVLRNETLGPNLKSTVRGRPGSTSRGNALWVARLRDLRRPQIIASTVGAACEQLTADWRVFGRLLAFPEPL